MYDFGKRLKAPPGAFVSKRDALVDRSLSLHKSKDQNLSDTAPESRDLICRFLMSFEESQVKCLSTFRCGRSLQFLGAVLIVERLEC